MFENLSERLSGVFDRLTKQGALSEDDVKTALREVRVALSPLHLPLPGGFAVVVLVQLDLQVVERLLLFAQKGVGARHVVGHRGRRAQLADEGARLGVAAGAGAVLVKDRDTFMVGNLKFEVLHTRLKFWKNCVLRPPENLCHPAYR